MAVRTGGRWAHTALAGLVLAAACIGAQASSLPAATSSASSTSPTGGSLGSLVGKTQDEARAAVKAWRSTGVAVFTPSEPPGDTAGLAIVVRQGAPVSDPDGVIVPLTLGVRMPDLTGDTRATAVEVLTRYSLTAASFQPRESVPTTPWPRPPPRPVS